MSASRRIETIYDAPMWESMERGRLELPRCEACDAFRYPPGPVCPRCLSTGYRWTPISGRGVVLSWVVFHRQYFEDHPAPYEVAAVRLDEGPIIVSRLAGAAPPGGWIDAEIRLSYAPHAGKMQHVVRCAADEPTIDSREESA